MKILLIITYHQNLNTSGTHIDKWYKLNSLIVNKLSRFYTELLVLLELVRKRVLSSATSSRPFKS